MQVRQPAQPDFSGQGISLRFDIKKISVTVISERVDSGPGNS